MSSVRIDSNAMRRRADQLYDEARNVGAMMEGLGSLSSSMQNEWAGAESDSFAEWFYGTFRPNLIDGQQAIGQFAEMVDDCAERLSQSDAKS